MHLSIDFRFKQDYSKITEDLPFLVSHKMNFLYKKYSAVFFSAVRAFSQKFGVTQHTA